jgi:membrane protease YdiL (CAAX protease family)
VTPAERYFLGIDWPRVVRFPLTRIVLGMLTVILPVIAVQWAASKLTLPKMIVVALAAIVSVAIGYAAFRAYVRLIEQRDAVELAPQGALRELVGGLFIGSALFASTIGILALLGVYHVTGTGPLSSIVIPLAAAMMAGVLEEIVFRGLIFRIAEESLGTVWALAISATLFGVIHLIGPNSTVLGAIAIIFEAGILLAAAFVLTRRLWLCIGLHVAWNFTQGGIFGVAVSGTASKGLLRGTLTGPTWLSGGGFGAEGSLVAIALCMIVAGIFLAQAKQKNRFVQPFWRVRSTARNADSATLDGAKKAVPKS